ncbi:YIP1 family protein [Shimia biformata]|uniref:YIP1 family protein n=1 Tax=Shimia biformata TaxID=1294299 RepID=UPI001952455D|nr:YIP1 family protein [Shimia biformata]
MSVTRDMMAMYRGPHRVIRRFLDMGPREDRALAILMAGCLVMFIAQWPRLSREAHLTGDELNPMLGGALLGWMFIAPLALYVLAFLSNLILRAVGRKPSGYATRIALFWAFLATGPILLLHGLIAGFIGPGIGLQSVGLIWVLVFLWFWISGLLVAGKGAA